LKFKGNKLIREYVEQGGMYLGLCAGGYYGAQKVEFEVGTPLEVLILLDLFQWISLISMVMI